MHHNGKNDCVREKERGHANKPERALMRWKQVLKKEVKGLACGEVVVVPLHATVGDLKRAAEAALRDTYCIAERLIVTDIKELMDVSDEEVLFGLIQSGVELCVRGIIILL